MTLEKLLEDLHFLGDRISTQVRTIALSILGFSWLILAGSKDSMRIAERCDHRIIGIAGILAFVALVLDYLQYFFGYINADATRSKAEEHGLKEIEYDYSDYRYRLRGWMFWLKQIAISAAIAAAAVGIVKALCK